MKWFIRIPSQLTANSEEIKSFHHMAQHEINLNRV
jgi:hypothetical protein